MANQKKDQRKPKILAVASFGGHLVQLMRIIKPLEKKYDIVYVTTAKEAVTNRANHGTYVIEDFSRTNSGRILGSIKVCHKIIRREQPSLIISTGAAPGLSAIIVGRMLGLRTLWVDSIANADKLSMCGKIASHIATRTFTQWPHLATRRVKYHGTVL